MEYVVDIIYQVNIWNENMLKKGKTLSKSSWMLPSVKWLFPENSVWCINLTIYSYWSKVWGSLILRVSIVSSVTFGLWEQLYGFHPREAYSWILHIWQGDLAAVTPTLTHGHWPWSPSVSPSHRRFGPPSSLMMTFPPGAGQPRTHCPVTQWQLGPWGRLQVGPLLLQTAGEPQPLGA